MPKNYLAAYIYGLCDPDTKEIYYIGHSVDPWYRFYGHISAANRENSFRDRWVRGILKSGKRPELTILAVVGYDNAKKEESRYIREFKLLNPKLTNMVGAREDGKKIISQEQIDRLYRTRYFMKHGYYPNEQE